MDFWNCFRTLQQTDNTVLNTAINYKVLNYTIIPSRILISSACTSQAIRPVVILLPPICLSLRGTSSSCVHVSPVHHRMSILVVFLRPGNSVPCIFHSVVKGKGNCRPIAVMEHHVTATECHLPYGITQCYRYPTQVNAPRLHPSQSGRYSIYLYPGGIEG